MTQTLTEALPIIDLESVARSPADRAATVARIARRSREMGFFYVVNHGIPAELLAAQLAWAQAFFALDDAHKAAIDFRALPVQRGYEPMALQTLQDGAAPDEKEGFSYSHEPTADADPDRPGAAFEGPNQWPAPLAGFDGAGFRAQMEAYRDHVARLGLALCSLLAEALDQPRDYFDGALERASVFVRLLHYPPTTRTVSEERLGCGAHTDWGLITLLLQDDCGGLEIKVGERWIAATPVDGALIVNLGDMVVRMTSGAFASNTHRVINRAPERHRYSVATFYNPPGDFVVETLPGFAAQTPATAPIRFNDHIRAMMDKTYATSGAGA